jgi:hypothetical protein
MDDRAAGLRAGGRIHAVRNETEDPRAPLLTRKRDDKLSLAPDLHSFVDDLQSGSDEFYDVKEEEEDEVPAKND